MLNNGINILLAICTTRQPSISLGDSFLSSSWNVLFFFVFCNTFRQLGITVACEYCPHASLHLSVCINASVASKTFSKISYKQVVHVLYWRNESQCCATVPLWDVLFVLYCNQIAHTLTSNMLLCFHFTICCKL